MSPAFRPLDEQILFFSCLAVESIPQTMQPKQTQSQLQPNFDLMSKVFLGNSDLQVSRIGLGCWPMAGITSLGVSDSESVSTVHAALDCGINFFDTAFSYGYDGRSDHILRTALANRRSQAVIAHKVGSHWDEHKKRVIDGRPGTLRSQAETCVRRIGSDYVDVMYLHTPDPTVPIEESAEAIAAICKAGLARFAAVSNVNEEQANRFVQVCPVIAIQPYFNLFQREAVQQLLPLAEREQVSLVCYWVLMKGLLSGNLGRDHVFDPNDRRLTYPIFQGEAWQRAQNLLDKLRALSNVLHCSVAQIVTAWTLCQPGISVALLGAKRPTQIQESVGALQLTLSRENLDLISHWAIENA